ncbi:MAG TPA: starch-binding protein [Candidatus Mediterraneibacter caccavium]|uniref:Alpha-amylase n=1 Tax=Candidatus Mediterraneibacter caccavium TaxID=2838661 RepID=A0A9D1VVP2_9FIRM|nr:starch-binding protein [Candidatus Mediterraneibacter caccavium]
MDYSKNSKKKNGLKARLVALLLATGLVLTGLPAGQAQAAPETAVQTMAASSNSSAASQYGLTEEIKDGAILHCWCWSFNTIKNNMRDIAEAGFSTIQTSPANTCNDTHPNMKIMGNDTVNGTDGCWWWHYQPTDWKIGNYQLGTRDDFIAMCDEADKYGIKVIVDVIPNHVTPDLDEVSQELYDAAGKSRDDLFHANGFRPIQDYGDWSWGNRLACTTGMMGGLPDVNTENPGFQEYFLDYLNDLIACGADGFRYDTAKHIGVPSDPTDPKSSRNNFWPIATGKESINGKTLSDADRIFTYGEVLQGDNVPETEYAQYMRMTASSYGHVLRDSLRNQNFSVNNLMNWQHSAPDSLVTWVESHDTYCNAGESADLTDEQIRLGWAVIGARANGTPLFYSRPDGSEPGNRWGNNKLGARGNDTFMSNEVVAVNKFRNAMAGENEYLRNANDNSQILQIDRGTSGTCLVNVGYGSESLNTKTNLADGTYTDHVSGSTFTVSGGMLKGNIGGESVVVLYTDNAESVSANSTTGSDSFSGDSLDVELCAKNVTGASYETSEGAEGSYEDGDVITVGSTLDVGESVTVTVSAQGSEGEISRETVFTKVDRNVAYIDLPSGWDEPYAYVYSEAGGENAAWPGVKMEKVTGEAAEGFTNLYSYEVPDDIEDPLVIFFGGDNTRRYPADMEDGLPLTGRMVYDDGQWKDMPWTKPEPEDGPEVTSSVKDGTTFDDESMKVTLSLENAESGTYSLDGGPEQKFTGETTVTVGTGKIADRDITLETTATDGETTTEKTFTFHKEFNAEKNGGYLEYGTGTAAKAAKASTQAVPAAANATSAALGGKYATNPNGQAGREATITGASDFTADMLIAQGVANDDPRSFRGTHEGPVYDEYALYGAWDDENVYIGWQYTNVTDVIDPAQGYPISDNGKPYNGDIPQMLLLNLGTGNKATGLVGTGEYLWGHPINYETVIDTAICFSSKPGVGTPALFMADEDGTFSYETCVGLEDAGISYKYEDGFFCGDTLTGIKMNGYEGYVPSMLLDDSSNWVDFLDMGHSTSQDTFYTMTIPMDALGITKDQLEENGIGVMHVSTFGAGGIGCTPMDMTMLDAATEPYSKDASTSAEKEDTDIITVPLAQLGSAEPAPDPGPGPDPEPAEGTLSVNFGADRSSPQSDETDLTLEAEAEGGEGDLSYQFLVDGKEIQDSDKTTAEWDTVGGDHTISVVVTDEEGHQVTVEKDYSISGEIQDPDPEPAGEIKVSSFEAALDSPQTQGTSVKFTVKAEGGEGKLQYRFYREKDDNVTVFRDYSISRSAYCDPAPGSYTIYVDVKDETGKVVTDSIEYKWIKADNPLTIHSFTASVESPQKQGTSVKLTVDADGGEGTLQYRFYRQGNGITTVFRDYAASSTAYCNPPVEGTYILYVDVKDESGVVETYRLLYQWE